MSETRENSPETAPKMCRRPGCDIKLSSANVVGLCQKHVRYRPPEQRTSSAPAATNGHAHDPGNGVTAKPTGVQKTGNGVGKGAAAGAGDFLEERLDKLILSFPVSDKAKIVDSWIRGQL